MSSLKYVRFRNGNVVIIPSHQVHSDVESIPEIGTEILSAGFVDINFNTENEIVAFCYGESVSLKLKSIRNDNEYIGKLLNYEILFARYFEYKWCMILPGEKLKQELSPFDVFENIIGKMYYDKTNYSTGSLVFRVEKDESNSYDQLRVLILEEYYIGESNVDLKVLIEREMFGPI